MLIGGLQKSSLLDYRNKIAAIVFTVGCNFLCPYCHNPELVFFGGNEKIDEEDVINFLKTRINKLDGVVITGGEPTLHKNLPEFIERIKKLGFLIKLDTNGTNPLMVQDLIKNNMVDYFAMDIKAPFDEYKNTVRKEINIDKIKQTSKLIISSNIDYEFRTTVTKELLNFNSFVKINNDFKELSSGNKIKRYYLQKFQKSKHIDENFINASVFSDEEFDSIKKIFSETVSELEIR